MRFPKKNIILSALVLIFCFLWLIACRTSNETTFTNLAPTYDPETKLKIEGSRIFHENDSISRVYLSYNTAALKYVQPPGKDYFRSNYSFSYQLFKSYESNEVLDENTFVMSDSLFYRDPVSLKLDFAVKSEPSGSYLLEITFTDLNADSYFLLPLILDKRKSISSQNFLPLDEAGEAILEDWISWKDKFYIQCRDQDLSRLFISFYHLDFPAAAPPFSQSRSPVYENNPEKVFTVEVNGSISDTMQFAREGYYFFQADTSVNAGLTLFRFHDYYPEVRKPAQLIAPLRYLTSNKEFRQLVNAADIKQAVDSFWVEIAGSEGRAEELIEKYYARVEEANRLFASHKEGWKTDRGMIYIIFGEPKSVFRRSDIETWIYGEQGNRVYLTFDFIRAINPFTGQDYELQRDPSYKAQWYNAILFWRR
jgi:GWxTD domain-containing protein